MGLSAGTNGGLTESNRKEQAAGEGRLVQQRGGTGGGGGAAAAAAGRARGGGGRGAALHHISGAQAWACTSSSCPSCLSPRSTHPGKGRRNWCTGAARGPGTPSWWAPGSACGGAGAGREARQGPALTCACSMKQVAVTDHRRCARRSRTGRPTPGGTCDQLAASKPAAPKLAGTASGRSNSLKRQASPFKLRTCGDVDASAYGCVGGQRTKGWRRAAGCRRQAAAAAAGGFWAGHS